jgi:hypothetical protein
LYYLDGAQQQVYAAFANCRALTSRLVARGALQHLQATNPQLQQLTALCAQLQHEVAAVSKATAGDV